MLHHQTDMYEAWLEHDLKAKNKWRECVARIPSMLLPPSAPFGQHLVEESRAVSDYLMRREQSSLVPGGSPRDDVPSSAIVLLQMVLKNSI